MISGQNKKTIQLSPIMLRPTRLHKRMHAHKGDVSEGTQYKILARKIVLGKEVIFYYNGYRKILGVPLNDEDAHNSEILRFTHASLLTSCPVGHKRKCYVDASKNPIEIWIYNMPVERYLKTVKQVIKQGVPVDYFLDQSLQNIMEPNNG